MQTAGLFVGLCCAGLGAAAGNTLGATARANRAVCALLAATLLSVRAASSWPLLDAALQRELSLSAPPGVAWLLAPLLGLRPSVSAASLPLGISVYDVASTFAGSFCGAASSFCGTVGDAVETWRAGEPARARRGLACDVGSVAALAAVVYLIRLSE